MLIMHRLSHSLACGLLNAALKAEILREILILQESGLHFSLIALAIAGENFLFVRNDMIELSLPDDQDNPFISVNGLNHK